MRISLKKTLIVLGSIGSLAVAAPAFAGCGDEAMFKPSVWQAGGNRLYKPIDLSSTIVGLWSVQFFAGGNMIDFGYAQWHSDGTEIMNSGGRAPSTENFCLGVWAQVGPSRYKLNHWALSYDPSGTLNGLVNIREDVVVAGDGYSGPFTIDIFDPHTKAALQHVAGRVVGKRITVNSGL